MKRMLALFVALMCFMGCKSRNYNDGDVATSRTHLDFEVPEKCGLDFAAFGSDNIFHLIVDTSPLLGTAPETVAIGVDNYATEKKDGQTISDNGLAPAKRVGRGDSWLGTKPKVTKNAKSEIEIIEYTLSRTSERYTLYFWPKEKAISIKNWDASKEQKQLGFGMRKITLNECTDVDLDMTTTFDLSKIKSSPW